MDNETEVIRHQMEETRGALQDKLETLEQQVKDTVQGATEAANETVQTVKEAVQETVDTVKETVQETVHSVKRSLDLSQHVREYPWVFFGGAVIVGFVATRLLSKALPAEPAPPSTPTVSGTPMRPVHHAPGNGKKAAAAAPRPSLWQKLAEHYKDEINKLQGLALGAGAALVREMLASSLAPSLANQVNDLLDSVTVKLGGQPIHGPLFQTEAAGKEKGEPAEYQHDAQMGRPAFGTAGYEGGVNRTFSNEREA